MFVTLIIFVMLSNAHWKQSLPQSLLLRGCHWHQHRLLPICQRSNKSIGCYNLFFVAGSDESFMVVIFWLAGMADFDLSAYLGQWYEYSNMFEIYQDVFAGIPITYPSKTSTEKKHICDTAISLHTIIVNLLVSSFTVGAKCVRATYVEEGGTVGVKNEYVSPL